MISSPGKNSGQYGFSLIELAFTLVIFGLLISLAVPMVNQVRLKAMQAESTSNLRQLAAANLTYAADHGQFCPADDRSNNRRWHGARRGTSQPFDPALGYLADYLGKSKRVSTCPRFAEMTKSSTTFEEGTGGYGYNASYIGGTPHWIYQADGSRKSARPASVPLATTTVMFTTTGYARAQGLQEYPYCEPPFWDLGDGPTRHRPSPSVHFRFDGHALVAWADGHVTAEPMEQRPAGYNPHGGDPAQHHLGWFGPDNENGFWNPHRSYVHSP